MILICLNVNFLQEFAISKNIQLGDEKGLRFPCVWDWSLQFTHRDRLLFHNPLYIGKSAPCVQNGAVKTFKRSKVTIVMSAFDWSVSVLNHNALTFTVP